ncbi:MAG: tetratricopeptide repeat protein [Dictyoglomaceae bacterium]
MVNNVEDILRLADDYKLQGKLFKAISLYEGLLREIQDFELSQWLRITLADLYLWIKEYNKAKEFLRESINLEPNNPLYYYLLGFTYLAESDIESARENFLKALELSPENPEYLRGLAWTEYLSGNLEKAELLLKKVLELDSENTAAMDNLIEVFIKEGKLKEAEEEIKKFRNFDPQDWQIFQRIQQLRERAKEIKKL